MKSRPEGPWVFGYGSLVWRPDFPYLERRPGHLARFARRFWQGSTDHRGVPGAPGRVVTLVPDGETGAWGMAYRLDPDTRREVLAALDVRERGGYTRSEVAVGLGEGAAESVRALLYVATPDNPNYLGPAPLPEIAEQIRRSSGPSGSNVEYVLRLAEFLRSVDANEPHVFEIERLVLDERRKRRE